MRRRPGFTLLELMVTIVLSSVIALLVQGTARAGLETSERQQGYRANAEAQLIVRELLVDALRHPAEGGGAALNDTLFAIENGVSSSGSARDGLRFLSRGILTSAGESVLWLVTLMSSSDGVRLHAEPTSSSRLAPIDARLENVTGLDVRVLYRTDDTAWSDRWDVPGRVPAAVAIEFTGNDGRRAAPPLVVHAGLEGVR